MPTSHLTSKTRNRFSVSHTIGPSTVNEGSVFIEDNLIDHNSVDYPDMDSITEGTQRPLSIDDNQNRDIKTAVLGSILTPPLPPLKLQANTKTPEMNGQHKNRYRGAKNL